MPFTSPFGPMPFATNFNPALTNPQPNTATKVAAQANLNSTAATPPEPQQQFATTPTELAAMLSPQLFTAPSHVPLQQPATPLPRSAPMFTQATMPQPMPFMPFTLPPYAQVQPQMPYIMPPRQISLPTLPQRQNPNRVLFLQ